VNAGFHGLKRLRAAAMLRGRHLIVLDVASTIVAFLAALALRFDAPSPLFDQYLRTFFWVAGLLVVARVTTFLVLRLYQRAWRYASIEELLAITGAVVGSSIAGYGVLYLILSGQPASALPFPRSVPVVDTILVLVLTGSWRFALRLTGVGRRGARDTGGLERALIVGSGSAALGVIREFRESGPEFGMHPVGALVDDLPKGQRFMGLEVLGSLEDLAWAIERYSVAVVLLALPSADGPTLRRIVRIAEASGTRCLTVPSVAEVVAGRVTMDRLREIDVEDLLRRAPARIDLETITASFKGKKILITGAGGSIGSELARQLLLSGPAQLVMLGRGENSIFEAIQTLDAGRTAITPVILDIRERKRLEALMQEIRPDVVFHAAAHKHVHLMELYPEEAVATNVLGTANVLGCALAAGVGRFVHISTDKAVNPTAVMGATKRVSEFLVQDAARSSGRPYASVRFGNVLSSRGSVVPIFRRQLERGGPLTVTHPDVERFFMTIPEAVQLVLQAAVLAHPGDTFVLDMGERVKIVDLARDIIELHGLTPDEDIDIHFTGLQPGEKLYEELLFPYERAETTSHEAVRRIVHSNPPPADLAHSLLELAELIDPRHRAELIRRIQALVPEYTPQTTYTSSHMRSQQ
jgi:FlaA1/EpsC-like NDP-sugar epimerase